VATLLVLLQMLVVIVGLMAIMAVLFYGFSWAVLTLVQFVPTIGKKHRHSRWQELTKRSARGR
jgi:carbon starvation protein CstA